MDKGRQFTRFFAISVTLVFLTSCTESCTEKKQGPLPEASLTQKSSRQTHKKHNNNATFTKERQIPACEEKIAKIRQSTHQKIQDSYLNDLAFIVADAKVHPVVYLKTPTETENEKALAIRKTIKNSNRRRGAIRSLSARYNNDKALLREVFLRRGYLFEDDPKTATAVAQEITLPDLFDAPVVYRLRNNAAEPLMKRGNSYEDKNGDKATLHLNDRVALTKQELLPPLHIDLSEVRRKTGAQRTLPKLIGENSVQLELVFPNGDRRPALAELIQNKTEVTCIGGEPSTLPELLKHSETFWKRHEKIRRAALQLVRERPLFDEPKDEIEDVQEDGKLRLAWKDAYYAKKKKFMYREVQYDVFDKRGNPVPPQVCVDFIFDTWERASGRWYRPRKFTPAKTEGDIDFSVLESFGRRHIASILTFAERENTPFERYDIPRRDWAPLKSRRRFVKNLSKYADKFLEGDVLIIHGLRDEDEQEHFHTVMILSTDPVVGIPTEVADNQGRPRISSLKNAMRAAPRRSIKHRLRLNFNKMESITRAARASASESNPPLNQD